MLKFTFQPEKTLQAAGVVLRYHDKQVSTVRLLKLLYIADRELLAETGRTLTGDRAVAMENGPVLSGTYNFIKQEADGFESWEGYLQKNGYRLTLVGEPGLGKLTKREVAKLHDVCERFNAMDDWTLSRHTHKFGEWAKANSMCAPNSSSPISWESALEAQGAGEFIADAEEVMQERTRIDTAFRG